MELNIWIAFWAGLISFVSPCTLPLYPSYISYITGISVKALQENATREIRVRTMLHTLFFIIGFSIVYFALGATANAIAEIFILKRELLSQIAGIFIAVMGLVLLGVFKPQLLMREWKPKLTRRAGYLGTLLIGVGFAAGWSPCIGPILGGIITLAATEPGSWVPLMTAYTLGFALPFFFLAFFIGTTRWIVRYSGMFMKIGGAVMILIGVLLYTGQLTKITIWLQSITPTWMG